MLLAIRRISAAFMVFFTIHAIGFGQGSSTDNQETIITEFHNKPSIGLSYGFSSGRLKDLNQSFSDPRVGEIKLGSTTVSKAYSHSWKVWRRHKWEEDSSEIKDINTGSIIEYEFKHISLANISNEIANKSASGDINTDLWRVNLGEDEGYGYAMGKSAIVLYNSFGIHWSRLSIIDNLSNPLDSALLLPYDGTIRFGTKVEGGLQVQIIPLVNIGASYERAIVFPGHLFWKWVGSSLIEVAGQGLIDEFVSRILKSTPVAAPVVNFVLKNGFSYGIYELRKEKMNYPFESDPPLTNDSFKIGMTFIF